MRALQWWRAVGLSLLALMASGVVNIGLTNAFVAPSAQFDVIAASVDVLVTLFFTLWYFQDRQVYPSFRHGFVFGVVLLGVQFMAGLGVGAVRTLQHTSVPEFSAHPLVMFISIIMLTLVATSSTGAYLSVKQN